MYFDTDETVVYKQVTGGVGSVRPAEGSLSGGRGWAGARACSLSHPLPHYDTQLCRSVDQLVAIVHV